MMRTKDLLNTKEEKEVHRENESQKRFARQETPDIVDTASVDSDQVVVEDGETKNNWKGFYDPPPVVDQQTVLSIGLVLFLLALVWPPLILVVAYALSKLIPYCFRANDEGAQRRQLFVDFAESDDLLEKFKHTPDHIQLEESYWTNSRGMLLSTITMLPKDKPIKAVICFCHGYTDTVSYVKMVENQRLVEAGFAFYAIEYEGHGKSDGPMGLIADWSKLIDDVSSYFTIVATQKHPDTPVFLMGESMGGAVVYSVYSRIPRLIKGVVFCFPMCKISDDMLPPQWVIDLLFYILGPTGTCSFLGYLPLAPSKAEMKNVCQRILEKRLEGHRPPLVYGRKPRLATARELMDVTQKISTTLPNFDAPFLVVHGKADRVTDPALSQALYDESKSKDKKIILYDDMWHDLTAGETDEDIDKVYNDIIDWVNERV